MQKGTCYKRKHATLALCWRRQQKSSTPSARSTASTRRVALPELPRACKSMRDVAVASLDLGDVAPWSFLLSAGVAEALKLLVLRHGFKIVVEEHM